jgi:hypothetical protein
MTPAGRLRRVEAALAGETTKQWPSADAGMGISYRQCDSPLADPPLGRPVD